LTATIATRCSTTSSATPAPAASTSTATCPSRFFGFCFGHFLIAPVAAIDGDFVGLWLGLFFVEILHDVFPFQKLCLKKILQKSSCLLTRQARKGWGEGFEMLPFSWFLWVSCGLI
jgi:hypothetical protein